ncbi:hypothetical protein NL108_016697 [Boleophthalmus pectinirostris]|uniref:uncharacterized protein vgf n=1 Tax=Boleophthalmus pectinirostris TaxID=150288 RepID=UPI0024311A7E|nr:uncharacterized protein vgf [Boleophthalmus pectinirostris]KAJ0055942.1 hypothetical protein NL108_016697 [Boleophthalmus pectinirostris]
MDDKEEDDVLFGDIEPQQLANILVKALRGKNKVRSEDSLENEEVEDRRHQESDEKSQEKERSKDPPMEDVTSHTIFKTLEEQTKTPSESAEVEEPKSETVRQDEEEQLTAEELRSLETMMKEFPRVGTFEKRDDSNSFNEVLPVNKNQEQKLKWREETQKALNFPSFSFMDELEKMNSLVDDVDTTGPQQEAPEETQPNEEESQEETDEENLSPEEEEARAKAEQDEMRRQAAEAQRARLEEEKLADIASDMLLRYMGKERNGPKQRYRQPLSDTPEDKRSDEQAQDLDPQTIDKLIEISSKLHLPADDVVDIISDVEEKKKRKDVLPPEMSSRYPSNVETNQPFPSHLRSWYHPKTAPSQDLWSKPRKLQPGLWSQSAPEGWRKPLAYPVPYYPRYPPAYYPIPVVSPPRPQPWYYNPYAFNRFLTNPVSSYAYNTRTNPSPGWRLLRKPVPYYTNSAPLVNPWRFKLKAPPSRAVARQKQWLAPAPALIKDASSKKTMSDNSNRREGLERYLAVCPEKGTFVRLRTDSDLNCARSPLVFP